MKRGEQIAKEKELESNIRPVQPLSFFDLS